MTATAWQPGVLDLVCGPEGPLPESVQRYRLVAPLGSGGQADVFRGVRLCGRVASASRASAGGSTASTAPSPGLPTTRQPAPPSRTRCSTTSVAARCTSW